MGGEVGAAHVVGMREREIALPAIQRNSLNLAGEAVVYGNYPAATGASISFTPKALGIVVISSGEAYVSVGTSSSADWKKIDN